MKYRRLFLSATGLFGLSATLPAAVLFDQDITPDVIFGSGNVNGSYTVWTSTYSGDGIELGLRAKLRHDVNGNPQAIFNSNGSGTYTFEAGVAPTQLFPTGVWSFDWSINSSSIAGTRPLDTFTYQMSLVDNLGASTGTVTFDLVNEANPANDALGNNSTVNGGGTVDSANYATNIGIFNVAQNSSKAHWVMPTYDPNDMGVYTISLAAFDGATQIAEVSIDVEVIPEPSQALVGLLCVAGVFLRRRQR